MRKSVNNATRATKVIRMIQRNGLTWKEVATEMKLSVSYLQQILRSYYKSEKAYNNLLAKGRANKKAKKKAQILWSSYTMLPFVEHGICN